MNIELSSLAALAGLCVAGVTVLSFWMNFSNRISDAAAKASKAYDIAEDAKKDAHDAAEKLVLQAAAFSLYREQVAREYIHREVMREVEDRLTDAINRLGDRLDRVLSGKTG